MTTENSVQKQLFSDSWSHYDTAAQQLSFSGYLYYEDEPVYTAEGLLQVAEQHSVSSETLISWLKNELLPEANGNFALVLTRPDRLFAATDLVRSRPIYIAEESGYHIISDRINSDHRGTTTDTGAMEQFLAGGVTFGRKTVFKNVTSLRPGEWIDISEGNVKRHRYFQFIYDHTIQNTRSDDELVKTLDAILGRVFERMTESVPHHTQWVVPLSGGHDSRLVVNYLYRLGIKNVVCYSYGTPGNKQSRVSQEVAESLGYRWVFIQSTEEKWHELHNNGRIDRFIHHSFNGDSLPHLQDFLAVYELKQKGDIEESAVFVPGHGIDFISDFVSADYKEFTDTKELAETIRAKYCHLWGRKGDIDSLLKSITDSLPVNSVAYSSLIEYFAWENRQTKFTANSMQVYEFFGYRWRIPFWEKEIVDFWLGIDRERRTDQWLYQHANAAKLLVEPLRSIPYANYGAAHGSEQSSRSLKSAVIRMMPDALRSRIVRFMNLKTIDDEGTTFIYARKAKDVEKLITPLDRWPASLLRHIKPKSKRYTYQVYFHSLTALYTLYREIIQNK